jgi:hypothetical protein
MFFELIGGATSISRHIATSCAGAGHTEKRLPSTIVKLHNRRGWSKTTAPSIAKGAAPTTWKCALGKYRPVCDLFIVGMKTLLTNSYVTTFNKIELNLAKIKKNI